MNDREKGEIFDFFKGQFRELFIKLSVKEKTITKLIEKYKINSRIRRLNHIRRKWYTWRIMWVCKDILETHKTLNNCRVATRDFISGKKEKAKSFVAGLLRNTPMFIYHQDTDDIYSKDINPFYNYLSKIHLILSK